jgi:hypothetical protein
MPLPGIAFTASRPTLSGLSSRADVAMFVGCIARRAAALPGVTRDALVADGWTPTGLFKATAERLDTLLGVPVPVQSWSEFDVLYAWDQRPAAPRAIEQVPSPLGLAVKRFFAEGGAKAYVVRTGDPIALYDATITPEATAIAKRQLLSWKAPGGPADAAARQPILPGLDGIGTAADPADPRSWIGAALIYAVDDAAMLLLPDLADLCGGAPHPAPPSDEPPGPPEIFIPCAPAAPDLSPEPRVARPALLAPRLDPAGYALWSRSLRFTLDLLGRPKGPAHRRDVTLVSAMPLPFVDTDFTQGEECWPLALLDRPDLAGPKLKLIDDGAVGSARLQLAYPWIATADSIDLPEGLESPEGALAGLIARSALTSGAFRSAAGQPLSSVRSLTPEIGNGDLARGLAGKADWLGDRLSLIAVRRGRIELFSDSSMANAPAWRPGGTSRLMGILLRACRSLGDDLVFEASGPRLWSRLQATLESFCEELRGLGAFTGRNRAEAYTVTCDATSMTQADIDAGRVIAMLSFLPAQPIERITVALQLTEAPPAAAPAREAA